MAALRHNIQLEILPWFRDHCFDGRSVLPAVESLVILAKTVQKNFSQFNICSMRNARFPRFLEIPPDLRQIDCVIELEELDKTTLLAGLYSKRQTGKFSRLLEHASVHFSVEPPQNNQPLATPSAGDCFSLSGKQLYEQLVPFGPAYQNVVDVEIFPTGAVAKLQTPAHSSKTALHGSPFLLDSAMHAACAWGQRFSGFVPFPVSFSSRNVTEISTPNSGYQAIICVTKKDKAELVFDIDIVNSKEACVEQVRGLCMRDVSGGRLSSPAWIRYNS